MNHFPVTPDSISSRSAASHFDDAVPAQAVNSLAAALAAGVSVSLDTVASSAHGRHRYGDLSVHDEDSVSSDGSDASDDSDATMPYLDIDPQIVADVRFIEDTLERCFGVSRCLVDHESVFENMPDTMSEFGAMVRFGAELLEEIVSDDYDDHVNQPFLDQLLEVENDQDLYYELDSSENFYAETPATASGLTHSPLATFDHRDLFDGEDSTCSSLVPRRLAEEFEDEVEATFENGVPCFIDSSPYDGDVEDNDDLDFFDDEEAEFFEYEYEFEYEDEDEDELEYEHDEGECKIELPPHAAPGYMDESAMLFQSLLSYVPDGDAAVGFEGGGALLFSLPLDDAPLGIKSDDDDSISTTDSWSSEDLRELAKLDASLQRAKEAKAAKKKARLGQRC
jgi:hypothetical protein